MISLGHSPGFIVFLPILFILVLNLLNIFISIWAYRDARRRGNSKEYALIVLVALLFFPIIGLIVYLVIRND